MKNTRFINEKGPKMQFVRFETNFSVRFVNPDDDFCTF